MDGNRACPKRNVSGGGEHSERDYSLEAAFVSSWFSRAGTSSVVDGLSSPFGSRRNRLLLRGTV